jgi:replicative DNA helicase
MEMTEEELIDRMVANLGNLDMNRMYDGEFTKDEFARFIAARAEIIGRKIHILDKVHTASQICAGIMDLWSEYECSLIGIDYLQMAMVEKDQRYKTRNDQVADHSNRILNTFRKTGSAGVMASQLSREGTDEPQLKHLRDSGAIEQDAEKVLFIFPPEGATISEDQDVVLKLDKHRTGKVGRVPAVFKKRYCRFEMVENAVQAEEIFEHHPPPWGE